MDPLYQLSHRVCFLAQRLIYVGEANHAQAQEQATFKVLGVLLPHQIHPAPATLNLSPFIHPSLPTLILVHSSYCSCYPTFLAVHSLSRSPLVLEHSPFSHLLSTLSLVSRIFPPVLSSSFTNNLHSCISSGLIFVLYASCQDRENFLLCLETDFYLYVIK